jgi:hypothetical protein
MEVVKDFDRPAFQRFYTVAGRLLFIRSSEQRLAKLVDQLFAGWLLRPVGFSEKQPDVTITICSVASLPPAPPDLEHFEIAEGGHCYTDGDACYLDLGNCLMRVGGPAAMSVELWLSQVPNYPDASLARAISFAVCAGLRRCGIFDLHSAGVVEPEGNIGALIIGHSGSGKSTLTLQLAKAGWRYLSDDELLLSLADGEVEARGFRSFFAVAESIEAASGATRSANHARGWSAKVCFEPRSRFPFAYAERVIPHRLFFITVSGVAETRLTELSQAETMKRLIRACPWATYDKAIAAENLSVLSRLVRQSRSFDLSAGADLLFPERAAELLSNYTRLD